MVKKWYKLCLVLFMMVALILPTEQILAAEKQLEVNLDKDYVACEFKIVFENPGDYEATLIDANGNEHSYARVDDTTMTCSLDKTPKGTYRTYITGSEVEDIGKVTLSVVTNYSASTDIVSENIMIGKDISGLEMYFKDDTFIATWTDETCGSVDVKVINLETSETIKNEKVTDKTFECKIDNTVRQIAVTIVPSSSSNIKGAELTYNFNIDNNPDAKVTFPDEEKTNQDSISVKVVMGSTYGVYVEENGECVLATDLMVKGTYDIEVPLLNDGTNEIMFYIVDADGNMRSTYKTIYKDTVPPSLSLDEEYDGITINTLDYTIIGSVANYDKLIVNGESVEAATDGYFEYPLTLHWGENKIKVEASDNSGNVTSYDIVIIAEEPKFEVDSVAIVVVGGSILLGAICFIRKKKKKNDEEEEPDNIEIPSFEEFEKVTEPKEKKKNKKWFKEKKSIKSKETDDPFQMPSEFSNLSPEEDDYEEDETEDEIEYDIEPYETENDGEDESENKNEDESEELSESVTGSMLDPIFSEHIEEKIEEKEVSEKHKSCSPVVTAEYKNHVIIRSRISKKRDETEKNKQEEVCKDDSVLTNTATVINIITDNPEETKTKKRPHIIGDVLYLVTIIVLLYSLFHFVLLNGWIKSNSMEPTLAAGDFTIANRLAYKRQAPQRGDIVFFDKDGELISKRVIGVAGDVISFVDGKVVINDEILDESAYLSDEVYTECEKTFNVPEGSVFVLGDNREDSFDSRYWNEPYVQLENIKGKLITSIPLGENDSKSPLEYDIETSSELEGDKDIPQ